MKLRSLIEQFREMPLTVFAEKALVRTAAKIVHIDALKVMTLSLDDVDPVYFNTQLGYEERFLTERECIDFARRPDNDMQEAPTRENLDKGDQCYAFLDDGELVSYGWYATSTSRLPGGLILSFNPAYVYMYQGYTRKTYRGQRLHGFGMARAMRAYCERGYDGILSTIDARNYESQRSAARLGYRVFGRIYIVRSGDTFLVWRSSGCKQYRMAVHAPDGKRCRLIGNTG